MTELVSPCCGKSVYVNGIDDANRINPLIPGVAGGTRWYECSACGKPCDPVQKDKTDREIEALYHKRAHIRTESEAAIDEAVKEDIAHAMQTWPDAKCGKPCDPVTVGNVYHPAGKAMAVSPFCKCGFCTEARLGRVVEIANDGSSTLRMLGPNPDRWPCEAVAKDAKEEEKT